MFKQKKKPISLSSELKQQQNKKKSKNKLILQTFWSSSGYIQTRNQTQWIPGTDVSGLPDAGMAADSAAELFFSSCD